MRGNGAGTAAGRRPHAMRALGLACALSLLLAAPAQARGDGVVEQALSFQVENRNDSALPCPVDGARYVLRGTLTAPRHALPDATSATLYLHGASQSELLWREPAHPRLHYAREMARRGHVSVTIDRLGYDSSGHPHGQQTCLGGEATVVHQVIGQLRAGTYEADGGPGRGFARVALVGFSQGGAVAQATAYSFPDPDALAVLGWADGSRSFTTGTTIEQAPRIAQTCLMGGEPAEGPGSPAGYVFGWGTEEQAERDLFHNTEPRVVAEQLRRRNRDGCGIYGSYPHSQPINAAMLSTVRTSVLVGFGEQDALFPAEDREPQRDRFSGSDDVTLVTFADAGHVFMAARTAPAARATISDWLAARGF